MTPTKDRVMKACPHCSALFDARALTNHERACKLKQEKINKINTELETSKAQEQTPQEQIKTSQNPSEKFKSVLILPLILILMLMKLILSTTSQKEKKEKKETQEQPQQRKRYLMNR